MTNERDPWVRVKDESELREGMAVQTRPCAICGATETGILLASAPWREGYACSADGNGLVATASTVMWRIGGACKNPIVMDDRVSEGRLYRLADDQIADDAEPATVVRGREMERTR